jgi:hypothetical protein
MASCPVNIKAPVIAQQGHTLMEVVGLLLGSIMVKMQMPYA